MYCLLILRSELSLLMHFLLILRSGLPLLLICQIDPGLNLLYIK
jgi:hypothetical protein